MPIKGELKKMKSAKKEALQAAKMSMVGEGKKNPKRKAKKAIKY